MEPIPFIRFNRRQLINQVLYDNGTLFRTIEMSFYAVMCLVLPIVFTHPQILVGTLVNAILILSAHYLKNYELLPSIIFPSIGVISAGVLFGSLTPLTLYLMPFIWIGNASLVWVFKHYHVVKKENYALVLARGTLIKSAILAAVAGFFLFAGIFPKVMFFAFSGMQVLTAVSGGITAYIITKARFLLIEHN